MMRADVLCETPLRRVCPFHPRTSLSALPMCQRVPTTAVRALVAASGIRECLWRTTRAATPAAVLAAHCHVRAHSCQAEAPLAWPSAAGVARLRPVAAPEQRGLRLPVCRALRREEEPDLCRQAWERCLTARAQPG